MTDPTPLSDLGWKPAFNAQLAGDDMDLHEVVRVMSVHRNRLSVAGASGARDITSRLPGAELDTDFATIGDWLLVEKNTHAPLRLLERTSLFKRRAPGSGVGLQLIAANVDTAFIVSSCNDDFNVARLERFLVVAREAEVFPVVVLTKTDLCIDPAPYVDEARKLQSGLLIETVNAHDPGSIACLSGWCGQGQTVAFIGSSGVGKSTLINTLLGSDDLATSDIRDDDAKGRHTTTHRSLHRLEQGGWLLDTPGIRELQLADAAAGLDDLFSDIITLESQCKFSDCGHQSEPGCAVKAAVASGDLDASRIQRWRKLVAEDALNTETIAERRERDRAFSKQVNTAVRAKKTPRR